MVDLITNIGEEFIVDTNLDGESLDIGLYNDNTDSLGEGDDLAALSTEPTGANYNRQSDTFTSNQVGTEYGIENDNEQTFTTDDSTQTVDAGFVVANFQSSVAGDGSATDHIIAAGDLSESRDLTDIDELVINAQDLDITVD